MPDSTRAGIRLTAVTHLRHPAWGCARVHVPAERSTRTVFNTSKSERHVRPSACNTRKRAPPNIYLPNEKSPPIHTSPSTYSHPLRLPAPYDLIKASLVTLRVLVTRAFQLLDIAVMINGSLFSASRDDDDDNHPTPTNEPSSSWLHTSTDDRPHERQRSLHRPSIEPGTSSIFGSGSGSTQPQRPTLSVRPPSADTILDPTPHSASASLPSAAARRERRYEDEIRATVDRRRIPTVEKDADDPTAHHNVTITAWDPEFAWPACAIPGLGVVVVFILIVVVTESRVHGAMLTFGA